MCTKKALVPFSLTVQKIFYFSSSYLCIPLFFLDSYDISYVRLRWKELSYGKDMYISDFDKVEMRMIKTTSQDYGYIGDTI